VRKDKSRKKALNELKKKYGLAGSGPSFCLFSMGISEPVPRLLKATEGSFLNGFLRLGVKLEVIQCHTYIVQ
jgi:hypothetical protein